MQFGGELGLGEAENVDTDEGDGVGHAPNIHAGYRLRKGNMHINTWRALSAGDKIRGDMADLSNRIRCLREKLNLTQARFAELLDVAQPTICRWEKRGDKPDDASMQKLARLANTTVAEFRYGHLNGNSHKSAVPVVGSIGAGENVDITVNGSAGAERVALPPELDPSGLVALKIRGNLAMRPLRDGWILYYRPTEGVLESAVNELCIVSLADGRELVKELRRGSKPGLYTLLSWNHNVDPLEDQRVTSASLVLAIRRG